MIDFPPGFYTKPTSELTIDDFDQEGFMKTLEKFNKTAQEAIAAMKSICDELTRMLPTLPDDVKRVIETINK